jgi:hypothetical protein
MLKNILTAFVKQAYPNEIENQQRELRVLRHTTLHRICLYGVQDALQTIIWWCKLSQQESVFVFIS